MKILLNTAIRSSPGGAWALPQPIRQSLSEQIMNLARPSQDFINRYGSEVTVIFRVGFMPGTTDNMIKGPQVSQRENRIEYIVRLPFCEIIRARRNTEVASEFLLGAVCCALESLGVDISRISEQAAVLVQAAIEKSV